VRAWFTSRGLGPRDLAKGLLIHEVLGGLLLFGAWGGCYLAKPSSRAMSLLQARHSSQWVRAQASLSSSTLLARVSRCTCTCTCTCTYLGGHPRVRQGRWGWPLVRASS